MTYKTKNIFTRLLFAMLLVLSGVGSAWAQRLLPTFEASMSRASDNWYHMFFANTGNGGKYGYVYMNDADKRMLRTQNQTQGTTKNYYWQFIGANKDNFKLVNFDGYYAKWDGTRYVGTLVESEAASFQLVENSNNGGNCWGVKRIDGQYMNPQTQEGQEQIREWSANDGGACTRYSAVSSQDLTVARNSFTTVETGIYRMVASKNDDRGFVIDKGGNYVTVSRNQHNTGITAADNNNSLWYVYKKSNGNYYIASLSYYSSRNDDCYFLKGTGNNTSYGVNVPEEWLFTFKGNSARTSNNTSGFDTTPATANYFELALPSNPSSFFKSTPGYPNEVDKLRFAGTEPDASYWEFQSKDESVLSTDQKALLQRIRDILTPHFTVNITSSDGIDVSSYRVKYSNTEYASGSTIYLPEGTSVDGYTFQTTCNDKFVWGPVIDQVAKTVTFDIRSTASTLTAGKFYQMVLRDKSGQVFNGSVQSSSSMVEAINGLNTLRHKGQYIYAITGGDNGYPVELTGIYNTVKESATYVYVNSVNGNNVSLKMQNGRYVASDGQGNQNASTTVPLVYQDATKAFTWNSRALPWNNLRNSKVGIGLTVNANFDNMQFFFHELNLVEYTLAVKDQDNNEMPTSGITCNLDNALAMDGKLYIPAAKTSFDSSDFTAQFYITDVSVNGSIITITLRVPKILHRQSYIFNKLNDITDAQQLPGQGFIKKGDGMINHPFNNDLQIQYTSNYTITQYVKQYDGATPANGKQLYMPTIDGNNSEVTAYQRWYDYKNEILPDTRVFNSLSQRNNAGLYQNGIVVGSNNSRGDILKNATAYLPSGMNEYWLAVDQSRYNDGSNESNGDLTEPSLTMRVIYHLVDAKVMANAMNICTYGSAEWQETHTISYPNRKLWNGDNATKSGVDYIGLNHEFSNYWCYNGSGTGDTNLEQMVSGKLLVELDPSSTAQLQNVQILANGHGGISGVQGFARNRFIAFQYPQVNGRYEVPENSWAVINVYMQNDAGTKFQLAKIRLTFIGSAEPLLIGEVYGKDANGAFKSNRSMEAMKVAYGNPVAELTFDHAANLRFECPTAQNQGNNLPYNDEAYAFPLDFKQSSYGYHGAPWASRGEYIFRNGGGAIGGKTFYPVDCYKSGIDAGKSSLATGDKQAGKYFLYVDASEQPGQVMSIPIPENLCAGTRMFCYGWFNSATQIGQESVGIVLNVVGKKNAADEEGEIIYSFNPGLLSTKAFNSNNQLVEMQLESAPWRQVGFSFLLSSENADKYNAYELQVMNNCYSTNGGDFTLDNFYIFANPPKGSVDFSTPLCSDKMRHAKIHADYDMLKNLSSIGVNDQIVDEPEITASYCFVDSVLFDSYVDPDIHIAVKELFERDEKGNHSLKPGLAFTPEQIDTAINRAFNVALVGRRCTKNRTDANGIPYEDHGFHSYHIDNDFEKIPVYSFNDSRCEVIYRETTDDGVRRIVFKEDIVRGEMNKLVDENDNDREYYPHMRPSRTYYLVFAPRWVDEKSLENNDVATGIFGIETSCAYFGTFRTKDPMHVILDNADIEADLPIQAVCHGEATAFRFNIPALKEKYDYPIIDEEYCVSVDTLDGKLVPSSNGAKHYRYEESFNNGAVSGVIKNMPYDWWLGGKLEGKTYRGTIDEYLVATHPSIKYNHDLTDPDHKHTHPADYKTHEAPVSISLAMEDFRFYYPDFGKDKFDVSTGKNTLTEADWATLTPHDYNNDSGYSLLQSEINTIKSFVDAGIIVLHRNTYDMPLTYEEAEKLQAKELSEMMEKEMNDQVLALALELDKDPSIADNLPLKKLEGTVLGMLSDDGKMQLTFEEYSNLTQEQLKFVAEKLKDEGYVTDAEYTEIISMPFSEMHKAIEFVLKAMTDEKMLAFAPDGFPNIGHEKRAYLVVRALNIMSKETVGKMSLADQQDTKKVRAALRTKMIEVFKPQEVDVLRKMWSDTSSELTEEERADLLKDAEHPDTPKDPSKMSADDLAVLLEDALAKITDNVIADMDSDRYVHFTLVPIMPSQKNFVDEPYIFCPDPRGVKLRITSHEPTMIDGFADMDYPEDMTNVPVRLGLPQIRETYDKAGNSAIPGKTLRIPVRGLKQAAKNGVKAVKLAENTGYGKNIFLAETDDSKYQQTKTQGMAQAKMNNGAYTQLVGTVDNMLAVYPTAENKTPDNFIVVKFNEGMKFREGYTYRVGINYMENDSNGDPTISCYGTMLFDLKIVPEYQKWTATLSSDWTNDLNWARADREELNAGKQATGDKIDALATALDDANSYISNAANETSTSFVPMYFTNVLLDKNATVAAELYTEKESDTAKEYKPASRSEKTFLEGLRSTATDRIIYDMEVAPSNGVWHDDQNYECGLFGTYVANGITFKPEAQLGNAHFLNYKKAWVEYELDVDRWYTLGSPLKASVAGDWYSPTAGGKQNTPHFYDITYQQGEGSMGLNDRFRPAYYQRSWDRGGNNVVYEKTGETYDFYIKADWSFVYNDATVDYSAGGFSVKLEIEFMEADDRPADGKVLVRLPKADKSYKYFDIDGNTHKADDAVIVTDAQATRASRGSYRLMSDDLKADGSGSISMAVANATEDNNFLLISNPFMAAMDMEQFFAANNDLEPKYWVMVAGEQKVSLKTADGEWINTAGGDGKYVAPLQGFFVKKKENADNKNSISAKYTAAMQTVVNPSPTSNNGVPVLKARTRGGNADAANIIRLKAERDGTTSTAMIILSNDAKDGYVATEDCETFIDGNIYEHPTVYTSADSMAQTINVRKTLYMVPVGMISSDDSEAMLSFEISESLDGTLYLYDGEENTYTAISTGTEVTVSGNTAGRYFITTSIDDASDVTDHKASKAGVWTLSGVYLGKDVRGLMPGVYVVDGVKMLIR